MVRRPLPAEIGQRAFERLELDGADRYEDESAGTADFIRLASKVARRDLRPFLEDWVYGTETPPMPGHPDWTVNPVEEGSQALRARGRAARRTP